MKKIDVVGAVIYNPDTQTFLASMRDKHRHMGGFWEFPGGKIEEGETDSQALIREIKEELNINIRVVKQLVDYTHNYEDITVRLITYLCTLVEGTPEAIEHECIKWIRKEEMPELKWAAADIPTVNKIMDEF